jgi:putative ABC transport system permease protein
MRRFFHRLLNLFGGDRPDAEAAREIAAHLALLEDEHRRRGLTPDEARLAARRALGSVAHAQDLHRDARAFVWIDDLRRDFSHGVRSLRRAPGFAVVAILTLALGIGANTAIFSVVSGVLLRPLPYPNADRLVQLFAPPPNTPGGASIPRAARALLPSHFDTLRHNSRTLEYVAGHVQTSATLTGHGDAVRLTGVQMTAAAFPLLGVPPLVGRAFEAREEVAGGDAVVVLSRAIWERHFNGDPTIVGRVIVLDGQGRTVVGVMPSDFEFPDAFAQYWVPYVLPDPKAGSVFSVATLARVREGASLRTAADEINAIMRAANGPAGTFEVLGVQDELVAPVKPALLVLAVAVGLVLLIACVNVANLLLARSAARDHEIAVRRAVGASPGRLVRQMLTESTLLASVGGLAGVLLAAAAIRLLQMLATSLPRRDLGPGVSLPRLDEIAIDVPVLAFTVLVAAATGILCGLLPALRHAKSREADRLRERVAGRRTRGALVVAEIAMAMVLLVGGGLLIRSFVKLATQDRGYDSTRVLTFQSTTRQAAGPQAKAYADQLVERLSALPGVTAAGYANNLPLVQQSFGRSVSPGPDVRPRRPLPGLHAISTGTIAALGLRVIEGRGFSTGDAAHQEALVTRTFARSDFFDGPAIGRRIYAGPTSWEVVGILEDIHQFSLENRASSEMYIVDFVPAPPGLGGTYFAVRTGGDPTAIATTVRGIARQIDPTATVDNIATMDQIVSNAMSRPRLYAVLLGIFAGVAMLLAAIGIYGVLAFVVAQRTREIGIRMALGARRGQVVSLVLRQTALLTIAGVAVGVVGAALVTRYLEGLLFGLTPLDSATFVGVVVMFGAVAAIASYVPARRATMVDPIVALR